MNYFGGTALMSASWRGYADIVRQLLEQEGIDVNARNERGTTARMLAAENAHDDIVRLLSEHMNQAN